MFRKILVPVDLAEPEVAQPALDRAVAMAKTSGGDLRLIHVRSVLPVSFMEFMPPNFDSQQQDDSEASLKAMADKLGMDDKATSTVRMGGVYPEVLAEAKAWKADLVVVGSHRPAMSTYLLGSNATAIVRHALCSVLVVRM